MTVLTFLLSLLGGKYKHFYCLGKLGPAPTIGKVPCIALALSS
jgi:hypothetical protein